MINEMNDLMQEVTEGIKYMKKWARAYADAERNYRIKKAQTTLRLKAEGTAVTLIPDLVKGECADEIFNQINTREMYEAAKENVNVLKLKIRVLNDQIEREWSQCKGE